VVTSPHMQYVFVSVSCLLITLQLELPFKRSVTLDIIYVCWTVYCECKACVSTVCRRLHILSWHTAISVLLFPLYFTFSALKFFLGVRKSIWLVKNWVMRCVRVGHHMHPNVCEARILGAKPSFPANLMR